MCVHFNIRVAGEFTCKTVAIKTAVLKTAVSKQRYAKQRSMNNDSFQNSGVLNSNQCNTAVCKMRNATILVFMLSFFIRFQLFLIATGSIVSGEREASRF
jgi:hypothetical protein